MLDTVMLLNVVTAEPRIFWIVVPLKTTVPDPAVNVPSSVKLPRTLSVAGDISVPVILIF